MFKLKTKDLYEKIMYWKKCFFILINFIIIFYSFLILLIDRSLNIFNIIIVLSSFLIQFIVNSIINLYIIFILKRKMIYETLSILKNTKLPKKLPKVVYVYTTHNDFWEARLLQSMQQTYKNIEYWISDGSSDQQKSKKIKEFCKKYKVHYHSLNRPSLNKADNLNHFLNHSKVKFDYLLISDSDVAIDRNFVQLSLKLFNYKNQKRLGWVSSNISNYPSNNLWNNSLYNLENIAFSNKFLISNINNKVNSNLYSSTSLISSEMLLDFDFQFPNSCLEDWYLECLAYKKGWIGYINPITISLQSFDKNIFNYCKRIFRVNDWIIKYLKELFFKNIDEEKTQNNNSVINSALMVFMQIIYLFLVPFFISYFVNYYDVLIHNSTITIMFYSSLTLIILYIIVWFIINIKLLKNNWFLHMIFIFLNWISIFWLRIYRTYKAFFRSKYADFVPSRGYKNSISSYMNKIIITSSTIFLFLIGFNVLGIFINMWTINWGFLYLFILINFIFGFFLLSCWSFVISYLFSLIKTNKQYDVNSFVYCNNDYINHKKIIEKWLKENNLNMKEVLN